MDGFSLDHQDDRKTALVIDPQDNVAVVLTDVKKGDLCFIRIEEREEVIEVAEDISFGHKIALADLGTDQPVYKYGEEIGKMSNLVAKGSWVHNHNMYCERGMKHGR